jgi:hypothetical protein
MQFPLFYLFSFPASTHQLKDPPPSSSFTITVKSWDFFVFGDRPLREEKRIKEKGDMFSGNYLGG